MSSAIDEHPVDEDESAAVMDSMSHDPVLPLPPLHLDDFKASPSSFEAEDEITEAEVSRGSSVSGLSSTSATVVTSHRRKMVRKLPTIIELNIGGVVYQTCYRTLSRGDSESNFFTAMLTSGVGTIMDSSGRFFIDRNGALFAPILEFLRTGMLCLLEVDLLPQLRCEMTYYSVPFPKDQLTTEDCKRHAMPDIVYMFSTDNATFEKGEPMYFLNDRNLEGIRMKAQIIKSGEYETILCVAIHKMEDMMTAYGYRKMGREEMGYKRTAASKVHLYTVTTYHKVRWFNHCF